MAEPWDGPSYSGFYIGGLLLSGLSGYLSPRRAPAWGALIVAMQLPVMLVRGAVGPLLIIGIGILIVTAIPAMLAATGAALLARRSG